MPEPKDKKQEPQEEIINLTNGEILPESPQGDIAYITDLGNKLNDTWKGIQ